MIRILKYVGTCARLPGHKFARRESSRVAGRARAYIPVIETDLDAHNRLRAGMDRVQQKGIAGMSQNSIPI